VAALLKSIPSLTAEEAVNIMRGAHNTGQAGSLPVFWGKWSISRPDQELWPWGDHREGVTPQFLNQRMTPLNSPGNELPKSPANTHWRENFSHPRSQVPQQHRRDFMSHVVFLVVRMITFPLQKLLGGPGSF
jgi:hypothetical protein